MFNFILSVGKLLSGQDHIMEKIGGKVVLPGTHLVQGGA